MMEIEDSLFEQTVNQELFEMLLREYFSTQVDNPPKQVHLTVDEMNAMRYACGYVPHSLLKRYQVKSGQKYAQFVECLGNMAVVGEGGDLMSYTKIWFEKVNRRAFSSK